NFLGKVYCPDMDLKSEIITFIIVHPVVDPDRRLYCMDILSCRFSLTGQGSNKSNFILDTGCYCQSWYWDTHKTSSRCYPKRIIGRQNIGGAKPKRASFITISA